MGESYEYDVFKNLDSKNRVPFVPMAEDLYFLHKLTRYRKVFNILEFGIGYSTIVMADALKKNRDDFLALERPVELRLRNPFHIYSVDASEHWISQFIQTYKGCPLLEHITITHSECEIGEHNGQICHFYNKIPNVVADFIFLDGPSPNDVTGEISGISFPNCPERTVMSGDLLKLEPTFLPGTLILIDGRVNNARFLNNNFKREYKYSYSNEWGFSTFELIEPPLGKINKAQMDYQMGEEFNNG